MFIITPFVFFLCIFFSQCPAWGDTETSLAVELKDDVFTCKAEEIPLKDILEKILSECQVEIPGLEGREDEPVSFRFKGNIEQGIKELMILLGEKNFTFEFDDEKLTRVLLPEIGELKTSEPFKIVFKNESPTVTVVYDIAQDSQAEKLELKIGDIIEEYDGVRIHTAKQLKTEVENKKTKEKILMLVKRDEESIPFELTGGIIGVRVRTELIKTDESEGGEEEWEDEEEW